MRVCVGVCGGRLLLGLLVVCVGVLGCGGVAWGGVGFAPASVGSFGPSGGFVVPVGLAVDNSAGGSRGDVYAADQGSDVLYKFSAGGAGVLGEKTLAGATLAGVAVDSYANADSGDVLVAGLGSGVVYRLSSALVVQGELKGLAEPVAVAFDGAGSMFVAEVGGSGGSGKVLEFNAAGVPVDAEGTPSANNTVLEGFGEPRALAVSADGEQLYIATSSSVGQYSLSGDSYGLSAFFGGEGATGLAVTSSGEVYAGNGSQVTLYEPSGGTIATFGGGILVSPAYGVGVDESTGGVYVADAGALAVDAFERGETPEAPDAVSVSGQTGSTAMLEGTLKSGGSGTSGYYFQYAQGSECTAGGSSTPEEATGGVVHGEVTGLSPSTTYAVCLVATNKFGSTTGPVGSFSTASVPPSIETGSETFSRVGDHSATVSANVNSENLNGSYYFEYGPAATFAGEAAAGEARETPKVSLLAGAGTVTATAQLEELTPQTEYEFRIVVLNSKGQSAEGPVESFTTLQLASTTLPDGRAYEMVTPPDNQDADVYVPFATGCADRPGCADVLSVSGRA